MPRRVHEMMSSRVDCRIAKRRLMMIMRFLFRIGMVSMAERDPAGARIKLEGGGVRSGY